MVTHYPAGTLDPLDDVAELAAFRRCRRHGWKPSMLPFVRLRSRTRYNALGRDFKLVEDWWRNEYELQPRRWKNDTEY